MARTSYETRRYQIHTICIPNDDTQAIILQILDAICIDTRDREDTTDDVFSIKANQKDFK